MPEFKLVVSVPKHNNQSIKVKVVGDEKIQLSKEQKEGRKLPIAIVSRALADKLNVNDAVLMLKFSQEGGKVIKMHFKTTIEDGLDENTVKISSDLLGEKIGELQAEAIAMKSKAFQLTLDDSTSRRFVGMKIGDEIDAVIIDLKGKLVVKGGSDNSGFPMRKDLPGAVKKKLLLSGPPGYHPERNGEKRRKMVRGNTIDESFVQINTILVQ
ncbi:MULTISPECIES: 30S ribosomal protein S6e [Fervidicoccus]|nr:30S ribosomal protein S6e [Fervidicoccus fontis]